MERKWSSGYGGTKVKKLSKCKLICFPFKLIKQTCQLVNCHFINPLVSCKSRVDKTHRSSQSLESWPEIKWHLKWFKLIIPDLWDYEHSMPICFWLKMQSPIYSRPGWQLCRDEALALGTLEPRLSKWSWIWRSNWFNLAFQGWECQCMLLWGRLWVLMNLRQNSSRERLEWTILTEKEHQIYQKLKDILGGVPWQWEDFLWAKGDVVGEQTSWRYLVLQIRKMGLWGFLRVETWLNIYRSKKVTQIIYFLLPFCSSVGHCW